LNYLEAKKKRKRKKDYCIHTIRRKEERLHPSYEIYARYSKMII